MTHNNSYSDDWKNINWKQLQKVLFRLQRRIFKAVRDGDEAKAKRLQKLVFSSHASRMLAIRQVTQLNQGRKTAGIDGKKALTFKERFELEETLKQNTKTWKHQGLRRCLKAGVNPQFPQQGVPQGGVCSPLLANIALNGIEKIGEFRSRGITHSKCIRYADDMVWILKPEDNGEELLAQIEAFLAQRGMEISQRETAFYRMEAQPKHFANKTIHVDIAV